MDEPALIGTCNVVDANLSLFEFQYDVDWLKRDGVSVLDPMLRNSSGSFYSEHLFGMLRDASPGAWGKSLLQRYENAKAKREHRSAVQLKDAEFLLRVFDFYRSGALRFKLHPDGDFLTSDDQFILPSLSNLRELEQISLRTESELILKENDDTLGMLVAAGAVLGGERPKTTVVDNDWQMWIAKFPSVNDHADAGGWEFVAHTMAGLAGINTSPSMMKKLSHHHHTFLVQRFDRTKRGERIHFASASTLLGFNSDTRVTPGYLDIAAFIIQQGSDMMNDLEELWRRMVFNMAIRNTDDRLDNHGFLLTSSGWKLSPVYDLNPNPAGDALSLNVTQDASSLSIEDALRVAPYFRMKPARARKIADEILLVKSQWNKIAADAGLSKSEQEKMSEAFR
jgi:serine/threonine-protein kinase HipA